MVYGIWYMIYNNFKEECMLLYVGDFLDFKGIVFYFSLKLCVKNLLELAFRRKLVLYCIEGL